jgi:hypothetical protein
MAKSGYPIELTPAAFNHSWIEIQFRLPPTIVDCRGARHRTRFIPSVKTSKPEPGSQVATNYQRPIDPKTIFACLTLAAIFSWLTVRLGCGDMVVFMLGLLALTAGFEYLFERVKRMTKK